MDKAPFLLLFLLSITTGSAQELPEARARAHLIYSPKLKAMLLIDGYVNHFDSTRNDVWKWDGKTWARITAYGPGSRFANAAALNSKTGEVISFGGWGKEGYGFSQNDTWLFDGHQWKKITTNFIEKHDHHQMVYANHLGSFVMYGGRNATTEKSDTITWIFKNGIYLALQISGPGERGNAGLAYDERRKKVVLFGGKGYQTPADLWEFDGENWNQIAVPDVGITTGHAMTYNEELKRIIIHGSSGTWAWDGRSLTRIAEGGPKTFNLALAYDPVKKIILAYGGHVSSDIISADLWELKGNNWKIISSNGKWVKGNEGRHRKQDISQGK